MSSLPKGLRALRWGGREPLTAWGTPATVLGFAGAAPTEHGSPLTLGAEVFWGGRCTLGGGVLGGFAALASSAPGALLVSYQC